MFAGSAVIHSDAREELQQLAEKLNAPVVVARCAKGALPEDHPLALKIVYGFRGTKRCRLRIAPLLSVPVLHQLIRGLWSLKPPRPLIQLDEDAKEIGREYPCDIGVVGDLN